LAQAAQPELERAQSQVWVERLEQEHDNLRAALQWALGRENQKETALQLATTLGIFWKSRGYWGEGRRWLEAALAYGNTLPVARAQGFREAAWLALVQGDCTQAEKFLGMGQELWEALKDDPNVTCIMGLILDGQGKYEQARALVETGLESYRQLGDKKNIAFALHLLGQTAMKQANYDLAQTYMKESIAIRRELGAKADVARSLLILGHTTRLKGEYPLACEQYRESLTIFKEVGLQWGVAHCLLNLGKIACARREYAEAGDLYLETLKIFLELGDRYSLTYSMEAQASLAGLQRHTERAARLWGAAQALRKVLSTPLPPADCIQFEAEVKNVRQYLAESGQSEAAFLAAWEAGRTMPLEDAILFARQPAIYIVPHKSVN
jgi:tetratricopeptide (TPR) repeat protein